MCWSIFIKRNILSYAGILHNWTTANKTNQSVERPPSGNHEVVGGGEKTEKYRGEEEGWNEGAEEE